MKYFHKVRAYFALVFEKKYYFASDQFFSGTPETTVERLPLFFYQYPTINFHFSLLTKVQKLEIENRRLKEVFVVLLTLLQ